ncbi:MAG TPA: hypothetical protein VJH03_02690 [Blastocatellia bacterium]|nr:hypothetical protein [Blastocatellia bacterium]
MTEDVESAGPARPDLRIKLSKKKQALFLSVIFVVFLLALEGALRLFGIPADSPRLRNDGGLVRASKGVLSREYTPGWSGWHAGAMVHINSVGWRGEDFSEQKSKGTFRILGVGDSFTFGRAVNDEDVWLERLEQMINNEDGPRCEAINSAHEGVNTSRELKYFKAREMLKLSPDVVVLGFTVHNDAQREGSHRKNKALYRAFRRRASLPIRISDSNWFKGMADQYRIARLLSLGTEWAYRDELTDMYANIIVANYADESESWIRCRAALEGFYELCRQSNTPLVVVLFPVYTKDLDQTYREYPEEFKRIHDKLKSVFAGKAGVTVVDMLGDLADSGVTAREVRVPVDGHPNRIWHEMVGRRLHQTIKDLDLLVSE